MKIFNPTTEQSSLFDNLENMDTTELLTNINSVDKTVPQVVEGAIPAIKAFVDAAFENIERG